MCQASCFNTLLPGGYRYVSVIVEFLYSFDNESPLAIDYTHNSAHAVKDRS